MEKRGHGLAESTPLTPAEEADEALLMGLRLAEGLDLGVLERLAGLRPSLEAITDLVDLCFVDWVGGIARELSFAEDFCSVRACVGPAAPQPDRSPPLAARIRATRRGRMVLNEIVLRLARSLEPSPQP